MKKKTITIPIYHGWFTIIIVKDWAKVNEKYGIQATDAYDAVAFKPETGDKSEYVAVFKGWPKPSVMAHEAVHLTNQVFIDACIKPDLENDEPYAYLLGWFVEQMSKFKNS